MRHNIDPDAPKLCNSCYLKEKNKPKGKKDMSEAKILIDCDRKTQIEVEEHCTNVGISISQYFTDLHRKFFDGLGCAPVKDSFMEVKEADERPKPVEKAKAKGKK